MFEKIIRFSVHNKLIVSLITLAIIILGVMAMNRIPVDAVPDITNNQVQVVTVSQTLAAQEVEQFITFPIEMSMANIPHVEEIRSISRFGLSVVTVVFDDGLPILDARQYVREQLSTLGDAVPASLGSPEMMPITTGLGEIYQYTLNVKPGYEDQYDAMKLRTIQDWIVKRQLMGTKGIVDVSSFGGFVKQYEVSVTPALLNQFGITMTDVFTALETNNQNSGGSYIEKDNRSFYIRSQGIVQSIEDIENIVIENRNGIPVKIRQVAEVKFGSSVRFGAMTMDGKGEVVGGITLMLKDGNSSEAITNVHDRIEQIKASLPEGVTLEPFLDRSVLVGKTINTVGKNLIEGGIIVLLVLILMLGNFRAGLVVASVIPLAMLFAFIMMDLFGVSANLMSLGAIDFGIVVDGAVIIVEAILHAILINQTLTMTKHQFDNFIGKTSAEIYKTAAFGVLIILVVFIPIMTLTGIEGKMFRPMAQTFSFAILGAFILTLTYVPMVSAVFLRKTKINENGFSERLMRTLQSAYKPAVEFVLNKPKTVVAMALAVLGLASVTFLNMGAVFIPTLEEGDLAMQMTIEPGSSLTRSVETSSEAERILMENFPEVKHVVSKIGTAEVPTDPMGIEDADIMIILKDKDLWTTTQEREELISMMKQKLEVIDWATFEFTQPIQLRFNELITGAKTDIAIKIFGEDMDILRAQAEIAAHAIENVQGAADVKVEQTDGLTQYLIEVDRESCARYGVNVNAVNDVIRTAYAGEKSGIVYEGERRFDLVVRLDKNIRTDFNLKKLFIHTSDMQMVPISELARLKEITGPVQIQREDAKRRITIGVNVRDRDVESLVNEINSNLEASLTLPPGYFITYGGAFENLQSAKKRLMIAVPAALLMILFLLYIAFGSVKDSLLIFSAVPLSAVGGVFFLFIRGLPFSISAGVGFIALFGVAVLNGIVLIGYFRKLLDDHPDWSLAKIIENGSIARLRPVLMTALVALLGFIPMAFSTSEGAEVQKPLATVVIGGLVTSTLLTLVVLPAIYYLAYRKNDLLKSKLQSGVVVLLLVGAGFSTVAQDYSKQNAIDDALSNNVTLQNAMLEIDKAEANFKGALDLGTTDVTGQYGEINAPGARDYYLTISQNLGNLAEVRANRLTTKSAIDLAKSSVEIEKKSIIKQVSIAFYQWAVAKEKLTLIADFQSQIDGFSAKAEKRMAVGDINDFEYSSLVGLKLHFDLQYQTQFKQSLDMSNSLSALVKKSCESLIPAMSFESIEGDTALLKELSPTFQAYLNAKQEVNHAQIMASKMGFVPGLSLGYFNQQIEGTGGLQGVSAGLSIPLWGSAQRKNVTIAKINAAQTVNSNDQLLFDLQQQLSSSLTYTSSAFKSLSNHQNQQLNKSKNLPSKAVKAFESGEMNYIEFAQILQTSLQIQLNYFELYLNWALAKSNQEYFTN
jgi:heavy metal efflux system protein